MPETQGRRSAKTAVHAESPPTISDKAIVNGDSDAEAGQPADPFDLEALRAQPLEGSLEVRELSTVPVRRPKKNEFFRVHPDPEYVVDAYTFVHESGMDRETYWVTASLRAELLEHLQPTRLFTCVNRANVTFLWPPDSPARRYGQRSG